MSKAPIQEPSSQVHRAPFNPYIAGNPVKGQDGFFGRDDIFREVVQMLRHPQSNAIVLYGQRRIGKTSVLLELERRLASDGEFTPISFDLQNKAAEPLAALLYELAQRIAAKTGQAEPDWANFDSAGGYFRQTFLPMAAKAAGRGGLVLLFDEFDVFDGPEPSQSSKAFFPYLRDWMAGVEGVHFVFVIGRRPEDLSRETMSTFKGVRAARVSLLERETAEAVVRQSEQKGGLAWTDTACERVWAWAQGHPYFTQLLCSVVWENAHDDAPEAAPGVAVADVDAAIDEALQQGANAFHWIWDGLPPAERVVMAAMAEAGDLIITLEKLEEILSRSGVRIIVRELTLAPATLVEWGLLHSVGSSYRFVVPLLRRWVVTNRPLRRVKEEIDRLDPLAEGLFQTGQRYYSIGQLLEAETQLRQSLRLNPNHLKSRLLLGRILLESGRTAEAVAILEEAYQYDCGAVRADLVKALLAMADGQAGVEQLSTYKRILSIDPHQSIARERRLEQELEEAVRQEHKKNWEAAVAIYEALLQEYPDKGEVQTRVEKGRIQARLAQLYNEAIGALEKGNLDVAKQLLEKIIEGGLTPPADIQTFAWMIAEQINNEEDGYSHNTFQQLGGVEGLLERFLMRKLDACETPLQREPAIKVLLALTDLDGIGRAGVLTLDDLRMKLDNANVSGAELGEAVEWLSRGDVRLITPIGGEEVEGHELGCELLIPALQRIAGKQLNEAHRVTILLDRRVNEWVSNNHHKRYLLSWRELRSIGQQTPFIQWGPQRREKQSLIAVSRRRFRLRLALASLSVLVAITAALVWYSQWGQLQLVKREVASLADDVTDDDALAQIAGAYAALGDFTKALQVVEKIGFKYTRERSLGSIAGTMVKLGERERTTEWLKQAIAVAEKKGDEDAKMLVLVTMVETMAKLGEKERAIELLKQATAVTEKIKDEVDLVRIAEMKAELVDKEQAVILLKQAFAIARKVNDEYSVVILQRIAEKVDRLDEKKQAIDLLREIAIAKLNGDEVHEAIRIAEVMAKVGEKKQAVNLLVQAIVVAERLGFNPSKMKTFTTGDVYQAEYAKANALESIAETMAKVGAEARDIDLVKQAIAIAKKIGQERSQAALQSIVEVIARSGEKQQNIGLVREAIEVAEKIDDEYYKEQALGGIAESMAKLGEKQRDVYLVKQAIAIAEKIGDELVDVKMSALQHVAQAMANLGEKEQAIELLIRLITLAERAGFEIMITGAFPRVEDAKFIEGIANAMVKLGEKGRAIDWLKQATVIAERGGETHKAQALAEIAASAAILGDFRLARTVALKQDSKSREAETLALILETWAKSNDPRLAEVDPKDQ